jgi:diadenosine tetraphosphatase ApaH/serine/threonine PP2A family protein phosphatase
MRKAKGPYNAEFQEGSEVRIADRPALEEFQRTWRHHNKITDEQLDYAGALARVTFVGFYHGGDELYELEGVPGIWHERCLTAVTQI